MSTWNHDYLTVTTSAPAPANGVPACYMFDARAPGTLCASAAANIAGMTAFRDPGHNGANDFSIMRQVPNDRHRHERWLSRTQLQLGRSAADS